MKSSQRIKAADKVFKKTCFLPVFMFLLFILFTNNTGFSNNPNADTFLLCVNNEGIQLNYQSGNCITDAEVVAYLSPLGYNVCSVGQFGLECDRYVTLDGKNGYLIVRVEGGNAVGFEDLSF